MNVVASMLVFIGKYKKGFSSGSLRRILREVVKGKVHLWQILFYLMPISLQWIQYFQRPDG
jgi:hypothetical protein